MAGMWKSMARIVLRSPSFSSTPPWILKKRILASWSSEEGPHCEAGIRIKDPKDQHEAALGDNLVAAAESNCDADPESSKAVPDPLPEPADPHVSEMTRSDAFYELHAISLEDEGHQEGVRVCKSGAPSDDQLNRKGIAAQAISGGYSRMMKINSSAAWSLIHDEIASLLREMLRESSLNEIDRATISLQDKRFEQQGILRIADVCKSGESADDQLKDEETAAQAISGGHKINSAAIWNLIHDEIASSLREMLPLNEIDQKVHAVSVEDERFREAEEQLVESAEWIDLPPAANPHTRASAPEPTYNSTRNWNPAERIRSIGREDDEHDDHDEPPKDFSTPLASKCFPRRELASASGVPIAVVENLTKLEVVGFILSLPDHIRLRSGLEMLKARQHLLTGAISSIVESILCIRDPAPSPFRTDELYAILHVGGMSPLGFVNADPGVATYEGNFGFLAPRIGPLAEFWTDLLAAKKPLRMDKKSAEKIAMGYVHRGAKEGGCHTLVWRFVIFYHTTEKPTEPPTDHTTKKPTDETERLLVFMDEKCRPVPLVLLANYTEYTQMIEDLKHRIAQFVFGG